MVYEEWFESELGSPLMTLHIEFERTRFAELRRRILELHPDIDDQTLADTLEGACDLKEAIGAVIRSAIDDEVMIRCLKERSEGLRQRLGRIESRAVGKRQAALSAMEDADLRKLVEPDFTASLRLAPPSVEILDENQLPQHFLVPQPAKADKRAILAALTNGVAVPGAVISAAKVSLSVRTL
jgi:hypothetical protein